MPSREMPLHPQRITLLVTSSLGVVSILFPWLTVPFFGTGLLGVGFLTAWLCLFCHAAGLVLALVGERRDILEMMATILVAFCSLCILIFCVGMIVFPQASLHFRAVSGDVEFSLYKMFTASFGLYLCLLAGIGSLVSVLVFRLIANRDDEDEFEESSPRPTSRRVGSHRDQLIQRPDAEPRKKAGVGFVLACVGVGLLVLACVVAVVMVYSSRNSPRPKKTLMPGEVRFSGVVVSHPAPTNDGGVWVEVQDGAYRHSAYFGEASASELRVGNRIDFAVSAKRIAGRGTFVFDSCRLLSGR